MLACMCSALDAQTEPLSKVAACNLSAIATLKFQLARPQLRMQDLGQLLTGKANHTKDAKQNNVVEMGCRKTTREQGLKCSYNWRDHSTLAKSSTCSGLACSRGKPLTLRPEGCQAVHVHVIKIACGISKRQDYQRRAQEQANSPSHKAAVAPLQASGEAGGT